MTLEDVTKILGLAKLVFPNVSLSREAFRMWHKLFEDHDAAKFNAAILALIKEPGRVFFPTPGEVIGMMQGIDSREKCAPESLWEIAVNLACRGLSLKAATSEMLKYSKRAARALRSVGWDRIRYADTITELPFVRKEFLSAVESIKENENEQLSRTEAASMLSRIAGNVSSSNRSGLERFLPVGEKPAEHPAIRVNGGIPKGEAHESRSISWPEKVTP